MIKELMNRFLNINKNKMQVKDVLPTLQCALNDDLQYREGWKANIAMAFKDECKCRRYRVVNNKKHLSYEDIHKIANTAAENFITLLCCP